jgi:VWFA-related protein
MLVLNLKPAYVAWEGSMRRCLLGAMLIAATIHSVAQRISVDALHQMLNDDRKLPDSELAAQLSRAQLSQRLNAALLDQWKAGLPGPRSQRALVALADRSAFLAPPPSSLPAAPDPSLAEQRRIVALAASYVAHAIPQLPHFYAARTVTHFESAPDDSHQSPPDPGDIHAIRITHDLVQYLDGKEVIESGTVKASKALSVPNQGLSSWGVFGPILGIVVLDAAQNRLAWSRWEQGPQGSVAVFRYSVPTSASHYQVRYCCVVSAYQIRSEPIQQMSGYHGEISVDPATGTIERITLQADLDSGSPITQADLAVEYVPVVLGGIIFVAPSRSVSISHSRSLRTVQSSDGRHWPAMGPMQTLLNDCQFGSYHLFHTETHVLTAAEERDANTAPDATLTPPPDTALPGDEELADAPPSASPANPANPGVLNPPSASGETQEISTSAATALPDAAAQPPAAPPSGPGVSLRVTTRLVDVSVVALDRKAHPIPDLKPEDFEVYDNGQKVDIHSFSKAEPQPIPGAAAPETAPAATAEVPVFSNRRAMSGQPKAGQDNTLVMLFDPANLTFNDFSDARQQMIHFLQQLEPNQRVALYQTHYHGYQVLEEPTADHDELAKRLAKWLPSAQDLANARDEEQRNRQQIETVHSPEDLLSVNGGITLDPATQTEALDPKLRELGSMPGPNALAALVDVANHLAPIPGHKSLVWVTSDNVLADWNRSSITIEKRDKVIEPVALRTQEAMNNAHISIYPVDASRLEASVINAEIGRRNVELTETFQKPTLLEQTQEGAEMTAGIDANVFGQGRDLRPGRLTAQMQADMRPVEGVFREIADATGGHVFPRSSNLEGEFNSIVADGRATYLLGFSPLQPADGKYHLLTVKLVKRRDVKLRYRTGYNYDKDPVSIKDRFHRAVMQPADSDEITVSAQPLMDSEGRALRITIAGSDLDLAEDGPLHTGKLDIFLVRKTEDGLHARVTGQTVGLHLKPATWERAMKLGLTFDERIDFDPGKGVLRVIAVDVKTGRMGSVTVPVLALMAAK